MSEPIAHLPPNQHLARAGQNPDQHQPSRQNEGNLRPTPSDHFEEEHLPQKTITHQPTLVSNEPNPAVEMPLSINKGKRVILQTVRQSEELPPTVRLSGIRQIQQVFYGDSYHPRSVSPEERLSNTHSTDRLPKNREISQSTILSRTNRNSLTPTKITFSYQCNPPNSATYLNRSREVIVSTQRKNNHLKQSIVKEVIVKNSSPPVIHHSRSPIRQPSPPPFHPSPPPIGIDASRKQVVMRSTLNYQKYKGQSNTCKIEASGKPCKLCELTRSHLKGVRQMKFTEMSAPPREIRIVEEQTRIPENQSHANQINSSPSKAKERAYLDSEDKYEFRRRLFSQEEGADGTRQRLNHDFLKGVDSRNKLIDMQLNKLNESLEITPVKVARMTDSDLQVRESSRTRKKIFEGTSPSRSNSYIRIDEDKKVKHQAFPSSKSVCYVRGLPRQRTHSHLHRYVTEVRNTSPALEQHKVIVNPGYRSTIITPTPVYRQRVVTHSPAAVQPMIVAAHPPHQTSATQFVRTLTPERNQRIVTTGAPIIVERIVAPAAQQRAVVRPGPLQYGLLSEKNRFVNTQTNTTTVLRAPSKVVQIPQFASMEMTAEVKGWYDIHRREIDYQAERICSYDLIKRYMGQPEISERLYKLLTDRVQPKKWLLMMVDDVYGKLKDRYVPISS